MTVNGGGTVSDLFWLAAMLSPRDVALHPNFRREQRASAPALLALLLSPHSLQFEEERSGEEIGELADTDPTGLEVVDAAHISMQVGTVEEGAERLDRLATVAPPTAAARKVVCVVLASSCYAELDRVTDAIAVLERAQEWELAGEESERALLQSVILLGLALRRRDAGLDGTQSAVAALAKLDSISLEDLPAFPVSPSVSWDSTQTCANLIALLRESALWHLAHADTSFSARLDLVRQQPSILTLRRQGRGSAAMEKLLRRQFDDESGRSATTWSAGGTDGDSELIEALFTAEFSGHPAAAHQRAMLGILRFLEGRKTQQDWLIREGLRLLRHGREKRRLEAALGMVREEGPLGVMQAEAQQVVRNRLDVAHLSDLEAILLNFSANLLGPQLSASTARTLTRGRTNTQPASASRWRSSIVRYETAIGAALRLAEVAKEEPLVLRTLLEDLSEERFHESDDYSVARLVRRSSDEAWSDANIAVLAGRLVSSDLRQKYPQTIGAIENKLVHVQSDAEEPEIGEEPTLSNIADLINYALYTEQEFPSRYIPAVESTLIAEMEGTRARAAQGGFVGRQIAEADVGVAYAFLSDREPIWPHLVETLCDPRVQRDDKTSALERILREPRKVPSQVVEMMRPRAADLIAGGPKFIGDVVHPYPSGLGVVAAFQLLPPNRVLGQMGLLLGSTTPAVRAEGARLLGVMIDAGVSHAWLSTSALLLSYDDEVPVRAAAGYALCALSDTAQIGEDTVVDRTVALLGEDGIRIPMLVLSGLSASKHPLHARVEKVLSAMAATHIHRIIRLSATDLLREKRFG